jgi:hypothetical protein
LSGIDWTDTPLENFFGVDERQKDGTIRRLDYPFGDGEAQRVMVEVFWAVQSAYEMLIAPEDDEKYEILGKVPVIRDGQRGYEPLEILTLQDLPVILDTLMVLEEEHKQREREESERLAAERKERERVRAKERRKLKKLGEW